MELARREPAKKKAPLLLGYTPGSAEKAGEKRARTEGGGGGAPATMEAAAEDEEDEEEEGQAGKKKRAKRKKRDPAAPKRGLSACAALPRSPPPLRLPVASPLSVPAQIQAGSCYG